MGVLRRCIAQCMVSPRVLPDISYISLMCHFTTNARGDRSLEVRHGVFAGAASLMRVSAQERVQASVLEPAQEQAVLEREQAR